MKNWMIYGANGYTGKLIVEKAVELGHKPILAGRNREAIETLAKKYDLESRVFGLANMSFKSYSNKDSSSEAVQGLRIGN